MTLYVISRGKHPSLSKVLHYFFISFVFICLCSITDRVNTTPSKRINTLWIIVIDTALAPALGLATSYKTNLLSREDRQILTFQHLPYLLLNILLVVYIYITICLCTSDPFICGGFFFLSQWVFSFSYLVAHLHKMRLLNVKSTSTGVDFFRTPMYFSLLSSRVKYSVFSLRK